jgi:hypothetical protein
MNSPMSIELTLRFSTLEAARTALNKLVGVYTQAQVVVEDKPVDAEIVAEEKTPDPAEKVRKPRADAGQPRGPYKPRAKSGKEILAEAAVEAKMPEQSPQQPEQSPQQPEQPAPAAATFDDVKAALGRLHDAKGFGMDACRTHLLKFGANRVSAVKQSDYTAFVAEINAKLAGAK